MVVMRMRSNYTYKQAFIKQCTNDHLWIKKQYKQTHIPLAL